MAKRTRAKIKPELRLAIYRRDNYTCQFCGDKFPTEVPESSNGKYAPEIECPYNWTGVKYLELDHIIPHSRGGGIDPENLRALCTMCNRAKLAKTYDMFWPERIQEAIAYLERKNPSQEAAERAAEILLGEHHRALGPRSRNKEA